MYFDLYDISFQSFVPWSLPVCWADTNQEFGTLCELAMTHHCIHQFWVVQLISCWGFRNTRQIVDVIMLLGSNFDGNMFGTERCFCYWSRRTVFGGGGFGCTMCGLRVEFYLHCKIRFHGYRIASNFADDFIYWLSNDKICRLTQWFCFRMWPKNREESISQTRHLITDSTLPNTWYWIAKARNRIVIFGVRTYDQLRRFRASGCYISTLVSVTCQRNCNFSARARRCNWLFRSHFEVVNCLWVYRIAFLQRIVLWSKYCVHWSLFYHVFATRFIMQLGKMLMDNFWNDRRNKPWTSAV